MGSSSLLNDLRIIAFDYQPLYTTLIAGCVIQSKQQCDTDADAGGCKTDKIGFYSENRQWNQKRICLDKDWPLSLL